MNLFWEKDTYTLTWEKGNPMILIKSLIGWNKSRQQLHFFNVDFFLHKLIKCLYFSVQPPVITTSLLHTAVFDKPLYIICNFDYDNIIIFRLDMIWQSIHSSLIFSFNLKLVPFCSQKPNFPLTDRKSNHWSWKR